MGTILIGVSISRLAPSAFYEYVGLADPNDLLVGIAGRNFLEGRVSSVRRSAPIRNSIFGHKRLKTTLKTFSCILNAGSSYTISHEQLHRALNNNCLLTSTIMIQEPAKRETTRVFTEGLIESARRIESPHFSEQELSQRLRRYLKSVR